MVPLKHFSNFWRTPKMPLINCDINLILIWSANCVMVSNGFANQVATFSIAETKLHVTVVTLSNAKLLKQLKSDFKRTINLNKYTSKPELLRENARLNHLVELSFQGINRRFVLSFENDVQRISNESYYLPNIEIKDYNVMPDG